MYNDRAEVNRIIEFKPTTTGAHSLILTGLAKTADTDSIRVKFAGKNEATNNGDEPVDEKPTPVAPQDDDVKTPETGLENKVSNKGSKSIPKPTIEEVSFEVHSRPADEASAHSAKEAKARAQLKAASEAILSLDKEMQRVKQQDSLVQGYLKSMLMPSSNTKGEGTVPPCGADLESVTKLLAFHSQQGSVNDAKITELNKNKLEQQKILEAAQQEIAVINNSYHRNTVRYKTYPKKSLSTCAGPR